MQDHDNSEGGFEHEHEHRYAECEYEYDCWDGRRNKGIPPWGIAGKSRDSLRLHHYAWMQIRNLRVHSECVMSPLAVVMAQGWTGYAARGTSRELLLPHKWPFSDPEHRWTGAERRQLARQHSACR